VAVSRRKPLPEFATTDDLVQVTGLTSETMYDWADKHLLPAPEVVSDGRRGIKSRWPIQAIERARFVMTKREFYTLTEIAEMVAEQWGPPTEEDKARRAETRAKRGRKKKQEPPPEG